MAILGSFQYRDWDTPERKTQINQYKTTTKQKCKPYTYFCAPLYYVKLTVVADCSVQHNLPIVSPSRGMKPHKSSQRDLWEYK